MKIQILGTGCAKCKKLEENARLAVATLPHDIQIEKVTQIADIIRFGVMMSPALAIDGRVVSSGKVLTPDEIRNFLPT